MLVGLSTLTSNEEQIRRAFQILTIFLCIHIILSGVKFYGNQCGGCGQFPVAGKLWRCADCKNFNLCSGCYNGGKHDMSHDFMRFDEPDSDR